MSSLFYTVLSVLTGGLGISLILCGVSLMKEALILLFREHDFVLCFCFLIFTFLLFGAGFIVFYGGIMIAGLVK